MALCCLKSFLSCLFVFFLFQSKLKEERRFTTLPELCGAGACLCVLTWPICLMDIVWDLFVILDHISHACAKTNPTTTHTHMHPPPIPPEPPTPAVGCHRMATATRLIQKDKYIVNVIQWNKKQLYSLSLPLSFSLSPSLSHSLSFYFPLSLSLSFFLSLSISLCLSF